MAHVFLRIPTAVLKLFTYSLYASSTMDLENWARESDRREGRRAHALPSAAPGEGPERPPPGRSSSSGQSRPRWDSGLT